jgi:hypothetical protein
MAKCKEEPERRIGPRGCERPVFLFLGLRQTMFTLFPFEKTPKCLLPPSRPRTTPAHNLGSRLVANAFQTATLEEHR